MFSLIFTKSVALLFNKTFFIDAFHENQKTHISIQQYYLTICVHDLEHDLKYPVFKVVLFVKFGRALTQRTSKATSVEGRPKTLPY